MESHSHFICSYFWSLHTVSLYPVMSFSADIRRRLICQLQTRESKQPSYPLWQLWVQHSTLSVCDWACLLLCFTSQRFLTYLIFSPIYKPLSHNWDEFHHGVYHVCFLQPKPFFFHLCFCTCWGHQRCRHPGVPLHIYFICVLLWGLYVSKNVYLNL